MYFRNNISGEVLTLKEFVTFIWDEAERQFENNKGELWCNLTREEQVSAYCDQYEHQIKSKNYVQLQEREKLLSAEGNVLIVNMEGGCLRADKSQDPDYPGIDVEFIPDCNEDDNLSRPRVLIEKPCDSHILRALIWNNPASEDYEEEIIL